ncbi:hypothetical protein HZB74_02235 [Candidatus Saccharibacteria bacterium]|nr:hypothetical protein [Candidatus Saccharibacteria bacterium]
MTLGRQFEAYPHTAEGFVLVENGNSNFASARTKQNGLFAIDIINSFVIIARDSEAQSAHMGVFELAGRDEEAYEDMMEEVKATMQGNIPIEFWIGGGAIKQNSASQNPLRQAAMEREKIVLRTAQHVPRSSIFTNWLEPGVRLDLVALDLRNQTLEFVEKNIQTESA